LEKAREAFGTENVRFAYAAIQDGMLLPDKARVFSMMNINWQLFLLRRPAD
jgi:hypothetical protein